MRGRRVDGVSGHRDRRIVHDREGGMVILALRAMPLVALIAIALVAFRFWARIAAMDAELSDLKLRMQTLERRQSSAAAQLKGAADTRKPAVPVTPTTGVSPTRPPGPVVVPQQQEPRPAGEPPRHVRKPEPIVTSSVARDSGPSEEHQGAAGEAFETRFAAR